jgi:hypothetical protein
MIAFKIYTTINWRPLAISMETKRRTSEMERLISKGEIMLATSMIGLMIACKFIILFPSRNWTLDNVDRNRRKIS